ncbi:MAG: hypothetical protein PHV68_07925, partial [Candidatus Gastranaerophilales bacterium]|nr:hypothetical protein [Candidatus Gastranaerophilales bacterium]
MSGYLHNFIVEKYVKQALEEDIGFGDITTDCFYKNSDKAKAVINSRNDGIICGIDVLKTVFQTLDKDIKVEMYKRDGHKMSKDEDIALIEGNARAILTGERTALNFIQRMSAIAT